MAYKKTYQNSGFPYRNNQSAYAQPYPQQQPVQYKKHSGAKMTKYTPTKGPNKGQEMILVTGWRLADNQLISVKCSTTEKSKLSDKGWIGSIAVTMTNTKTGAKSFHWGTMQKSTGKVVVDDVAIVLNPKAKNGGYCGTYLK